MTMETTALGLPPQVTACLFDLDGVLTETASVHAKAWKQTFDEYLKARAEREGEDFVEFDAGADYNEYVDGKPRYDGVRSFLASRGIELPEGEPSDPPSAATVCGIGNRKNELVLELMDRDGVEPYPGSVKFVEAARDAGLRRAVVSSSANCQAVLEAAGIDHLFEQRIDGKVAAEEHLKGKPAPDTYLAGARAVGVPPEQAAVFEDATSGVAAGRAGGFGSVVGVDRVDHAEALREHGATVVVKDLADLLGERMISHPAFAIEPWALRETSLDLDVLAQSESVFALANGHLGMRGNLDEGEPHALPGTYLNAFWEVRPLPYAEAGYGYPEAGETVVNVTNGKLIRLLVDDSPFDIRYGELESHERLLDLRAGTLRREVVWRSPAGKAVRIVSERLVSFAQRSVAAIHYEVEPLEESTRLVVQSELVANEPRPAASGDPRAAAALEAPLRGEEAIGRDTRAVLVHSTKGSELRAGGGDGPRGRGSGLDPLRRDRGLDRPGAADGDGDGGARREPEAGQVPRLRLVERALGAGGARPGRRRAGRGAAHRLGRAGRRTARLPRRLLGRRRRRAGRRRRAAAGGPLRPLPHPAGRRPRRAPGDRRQGPDRPRLRRPLLLGHRVLRAAGADLHGAGGGRGGARLAPGHDRGRPPAGAGARARGRALPLAHDQRQRVLGLLAGRHRRLPHRRRRRRRRDPLPAGDRRHGLRTRDGAPILVETARLWRSLGHHDAAGRFRIDGVTGPDEYSAVADNNVYTNLMAQRNLAAAAEIASRHPDPAAELGVDEEEAASWRDAATAMTIPYDDQLGVHPQSEGFTDHDRWDFDSTGPDEYPLLLHFPYFDLYRKQVVKQADLVMALFTRGDAFSAEEKARNFAYYEQLTVRDSSLSACVQAVIAAEVGQLELAYDYFGEAALMDLADLEHNTRDGLHIASLAGAWIATVAGFGGMRDHDGELSFAPRLPERLTRLAFRVGWHGSCVEVEVKDHEVSYRLLDGHPFTVRHFGEAVEVTTKGSSHPAAPMPPLTEQPGQPAGRAPTRRRPPRS